MPGKVTKLILGTSISRHMKDKKVIRKSQYGFTHRKLFLTRLITIYNEMTGI